MKKFVVYIYLLFMALCIVSCGGGGGGSTASGAGTGTATLKWSAPTTNADGSQLTDLAGFKIYYGTESGSYPQTIDVGNVITYQVVNLPKGTTYYFIITAYNNAGVESDPSNEASKAL